jgi:hypothetical protein
VVGGLHTDLRRLSTSRAIFRGTSNGPTSFRNLSSSEGTSMLCLRRYTNDKFRKCLEILGPDCRNDRRRITVGAC